MINCIEKNIPKFQDKITFGKYGGKILWLIDEDLEYKISLLEKMYNKNKLKEHFLNPKYNYSIGSLIYM